MQLESTINHAEDLPVSAAVRANESLHEDQTAKLFLISSISYFFIVGIVALAIAAKFVWPQLLGTIPYLSYGRLRPLHVNGMLFGWLLAADMGLSYYLIPRLCGVKLWSEKLGVATAILWNAIILGAVVSTLMGWNQGLESSPGSCSVLTSSERWRPESTLRCMSASGTRWERSSGRPSSI